MSRVRRVETPDAALTVEVDGEGTPVVVVQTALDIDELLPLSRGIAAAGEIEVCHVRRPGYGGSPRPPSSPSVPADAARIAHVIGALHDRPVHVVGASYSATVALTLASEHPRRVRSLVLVEPPPFGTSGAEEFRAATRELVRSSAEAGPTVALESIMTMLDGRDWRTSVEGEHPGSVARMERDAPTFFGTDLPALLAWHLTDEEAARVTCPTLLVGGGESPAWFPEMLSRLERVLPAATRVQVAGAGHTVALSRAGVVAEAVVGHVHDVERGYRTG